MNKYLIHILVALTCLIMGSSYADELLKTEKSWNGGSFSYPEGDPLITSIRVVLEQDQATPLHCHPVPAIGYIIAGKLMVETSSGESEFFESGESLVEVMRTPHVGTAIEGPVDLVVFYLGAKGVPNTVLSDSDTYSNQCES